MWAPNPPPSLLVPRDFTPAEPREGWVISWNKEGTKPQPCLLGVSVSSSTGALQPGPLQHTLGSLWRQLQKRKWWINMSRNCLGQKAVEQSELQRICSENEQHMVAFRFKERERNWREAFKCICLCQWQAAPQSVSWSFSVLLDDEKTKLVTQHLYLPS